MDRARHRTTTVYGGRAQEGVLEVYMSFYVTCVFGLKTKTLVLSNREHDCRMTGIGNATRY